MLYLNDGVSLVYVVASVLLVTTGIPVIGEWASFQLVKRRVPSNEVVDLSIAGSDVTLVAARVDCSSS